MKNKIKHPKKLTEAFSKNVPGKVRIDTIERKSLFAKNPKTYPVPPLKPEETPLIFPGKTSPIKIHGRRRIPLCDKKALLKSRVNGIQEYLFSIFCVSSIKFEEIVEFFKVDKLIS